MRARRVGASKRSSRTRSIAQWLSSRGSQAADHATDHRGWHSARSGSTSIRSSRATPITLMTNLHAHGIVLAIQVLTSQLVRRDRGTTTVASIDSDVTPGNACRPRRSGGIGDGAGPRTVTQQGHGEPCLGAGFSRCRAGRLSRTSVGPDIGGGLGPWIHAAGCRSTGEMCRRRST